MPIQSSYCTNRATPLFPDFPCKNSPPSMVLLSSIHLLCRATCTALARTCVRLHDTEDAIHARQPHFPRYVMVVHFDVQWHNRRVGYCMDCRRKHRFLGLRAQQAWHGVRVTSSLGSAWGQRRRWRVRDLARVGRARPGHPRHSHGSMRAESNNERW